MIVRSVEKSDRLPHGRKLIVHLSHLFQSLGLTLYYKINYHIPKCFAFGEELQLPKENIIVSKSSKLKKDVNFVSF